MVTRCKHCDKPIALNETAWTCGPMFCSHSCGVKWAKTLYTPDEYNDEDELAYKAASYFDDVAEEISREDYGARTERFTAYSKDYDMSTVFEQIYEGDELIAQTCIGWHYGEPDADLERSIETYGLTATFVEIRGEQL